MINTKSIIVLAKKELGYFFNSPVGLISIFIAAVFSNFLFMKDIFVRGDGGMRSMFESMLWVLMILIPTITMRSISEEKKSKTLELLMSLPISELEIVLGKTIANLIVVIAMFVATLSVPLGIGVIASIVAREVLISYLGMVFLATAFVSIGIFISTLTENQIISLLVTLFVLFFMILMGDDFVTSVFPDMMRSYLPTLAPIFHLSPFLKGVVDFRSVFYFFSITFAMTLLSVINLKKRN